MKLYSLETLSQTELGDKPTVVVLGTFDGVHLGHRKLIERAKAQDAHICIFTFAQNPFGTPALVSLEEKLKLFYEAGAEYAYVAEFDEVRELDWQDFAKELLIKKLNCRCCVCGFNFRFGKKAEGTAAALKEFMEQRGLCCFVEDAFCIDGEPVSSSRIRALLQKGDAEGAARLLGRNYTLEYHVTHGNGIGKSLGFPTLNQPLKPGMIACAGGVYISRCLGMPAVTNIGVRPTVTDESQIVHETFIIDYEGDLYGRDIKVELISKIRDEIKFPSFEALSKQIEADVEKTKKYFKINVE